MFNKLHGRFNTYLKENYIIVALTTGVLMFGVIIGVLAVNFLSNTQVEELNIYISTYIDQIKNGILFDQRAIFLHSFWQNSRFLFLFWLLGLTIFGIPFTLILLFAKGFTFGFAITFFVQDIWYKGLLFIAGAVLPQNLFILPTYIFASTTAICFALMTNSYKKRNIAFLNLNNLLIYTLFFFSLLILIIIGSVTEAYITPVFMQWIVELL